MALKSNQENFNRSNTDKLVDIAEMLGIVNSEDVIDIENIAKEVEHFWFGDKSYGFNKKFPQFIDGPDKETVMHVTEEDKDLLTHYYGTALSQKQEGTKNTFLAGLFHEFRGYRRGHTIEDTISDLFNNFSSLSPDFLASLFLKCSRSSGGILPFDIIVIHLQTLIEYLLLHQLDQEELV